MYTYLKFGLPRVFPPSRNPRDGSSGYNSSDDGSPGPPKPGRGPMRTRSEMDFRNLQMHSSYTRVCSIPLSVITAINLQSTFCFKCSQKVLFDKELIYIFLMNDLNGSR